MWGLLGDFDMDSVYEGYEVGNLDGIMMAVLLFVYMFVVTIVLVNLLIAQVRVAVCACVCRVPCVCVASRRAVLPPLAKALFHHHRPNSSGRHSGKSQTISGK